MKIATCIVGNPRSFKRTFPSFQKNFLEKINTDIFIHTFNNTGQERPDLQVDGTAIEYIELYSPIRSKIDELNFNFQMGFTMEPYFKSCYEVMQLVKNYEEEQNFKYDIIIKTRADIHYDKPLNIEILNIAINNKNTIFVHHVCDLYKYYYGNNLFEDSPIQAAQKALEKNITSFKIDKQNEKEFLPSDYTFLGDRDSMKICLEEPFKQISKLSEFSPGGEKLLSHIVDIFNIKYGLSTLYLNTNCLR